MSTLTQVSKYTILSRIGQGAMGRVYKAQDTVLNRAVAIKTIAEANGGMLDTGLIERFRREAQAAAGLTHPNIITVYDFGEEDGVLYLAMELLDGSDLSEIMRRRAYGRIEDRLGLMEQIADGVAFAHSRGVIHRDLKPANLHVLPSGAVKIMDFGLARSGESAMTRSGQILGTPYFMAPEQVRGEPADARCDVFSLGSIFYEMLCGMRPFPAETMHAVFFQILQRSPEPLRQHNPAVPVPLDAVIMRALEKDPGARFANAGELREALRHARSALDGRIQSDDAVRYIRPAQSGADQTVLLRSGAASRARDAAGPGATSHPPSAEAIYSVTYQNEAGGDMAVEIAGREVTLLDAALAAGVPHFHECGGRARCSTCRVRVVAGMQNLQPRTATEKQMAQRLGWGDELRLACQTKLLGDAAVQRLIHDSDDFGLLRNEASGEEATQEVPLAIMHAHLADGAGFIRRAPPYDVVHLLNRFFLQVCDPVLANGGAIERYTGEGLVAVFGLRGGGAREKCLDATRAALRMQARMKEFNQYLKDHFGAELKLGIALHFSRLVVGRIGHPLRPKLTALGDAVGAVLEAVPHAAECDSGILAAEELVNVIESDLEIGRAVRDPAAAGGRGPIFHELVDFAKPDAVFVVQSSFDQIAARKAESGALFYRLLFELAPAVRPMFEKVDMAAQQEMLINVLGTAIASLDRFDALRPTLEELGRRHVAYGVRLEHYDAVEQALLEMLRQMLGEQFTLDVRLAWSRVYNQMTAVMIEGAQNAGPAN